MVDHLSWRRSLLAPQGRVLPATARIYAALACKALTLTAVSPSATAFKTLTSTALSPSSTAFDFPVAVFHLSFTMVLCCLQLRPPSLRSPAAAAVLVCSPLKHPKSTYRPCCFV